jgi:acyl carrier protein
MKRQLLLNIAQIVLILLGVTFFLLSSGKIATNLGWSFPWYFSVIFFAFAIICGFYAHKLADEAARQRVLSYMAGRPALSEKEFGEKYFPSDRAEIAARLRIILARHVNVGLSQMQPTDRFIEDLRMDDFDSMSTVEYVIEIEKEFGIKIPDSAAEKMTTFQDVVDYVSEAVKFKAS